MVVYCLYRKAPRLFCSAKRKNMGLYYYKVSFLCTFLISSASTLSMYAICLLTSVTDSFDDRTVSMLLGSNDHDAPQSLLPRISN